MLRVAMHPQTWLPRAVRDGHPDAPFATDGTTLGELLAYAGRIVGLGSKATVCVGSDDRFDVAAALLSAFAGGPRVVLPHALTPAALGNVFAAQPYDYWLGPVEWQTAVEGVRITPDDARGSTTVDRYGLGDTDAVALWLFTGGSTGRPKLWAKSARHLLGEAAMLAHTFGVGPEDRVLSTAPPNHIYGVLFSVLLPLLSGAPVERTAPFFPAEAARRIETSGATIIVTTPVHVRALLGAKWRCNAARLVFTSGAPLARADARALRDEAGIWPIEVYGSTETGGVAARAWADSTCDWKALPGVEWRLTGAELAVRSPYISDEAPRDGDGYYRTADTAVDVGGGRFELAGRADGVVKVGGRRVDLREVEDLLRAQQGVRDAIVLARPSRAGRDSEIVAVAESTRSSADLSAVLRSILPSPAWPRVVRCVDRIPVTPAGKRDLEAVARMIEERPG
jgi:acyl-coenzyme A synthetase/AMP-(fatty) acid ligase